MVSQKYTSLKPKWFQKRQRDPLFLASPLAYQSMSSQVLTNCPCQETVPVLCTVWLRILLCWLEMADASHGMVLLGFNSSWFLLYVPTPTAPFPHYWCQFVMHSLAEWQSWQQTLLGVSMVSREGGIKWGQGHPNIRWILPHKEVTVTEKDPILDPAQWSCLTERSWSKSTLPDLVGWAGIMMGSCKW